MKRITSFILLILLIVPLCASAEFDDEDPQIFGLELEKLLNLGSGILAIILLVITLIAYARTQRNKLIFVSVAFLLFALKGFLTAHELFIDELSWVDPAASALNFAILSFFFAGLLKK